MIRSIPLLVGLSSVAALADEPVTIKFDKCPAAVQATLKAESHSAKIENVEKDKSEEGTTYWAEATISGRKYAIGVDEDGTLNEIHLAIDADEVPLEKCPAAVRETFEREGWNQKIETVGKDMKYGVVIYETAVEHAGKAYDLIVAEDGTLLEKSLIADEDDLELADCPAAVRDALKAQAKGGEIGPVTRIGAVHKAVFEATVTVGGKGYLIEVSEGGTLISKTRQDLE